MFIINQKQLLVGEALADKFHPMHAQALEYDSGLKELKELFGNSIKFIRPGYPKFNPGMDSEGRASTMLEPPTPATFPLSAYVTHPTRGKETWACCLDFPKLLPNGLWEMGRKRSIFITDAITVNIDKDPDLAFYLYKVCNAIKDGRLAVDNPKAEIRTKANKAREETELQVAIWNVLKDEFALVRIAQSWGIAEAGTKDPDALRFELKDLLIANNEKKKLDPSVKGTKEFLAELKITDNIRLRAFIRELMDSKVLIYKPDGRVWIGDRNLMQVPYSAINDVFDYICNFYGSQNNKEKLQDLMRDVVTKEMLDGVVDEKDLKWLCKIMDINTSFKKSEDTKALVYGAFNIAL
jgi:predicted transcriptional regulator